MPEQEHGERSNAHAAATLQSLQDAEQEGIDASGSIDDLTTDRDTWECARCERLHFSRAEAFRCCSDRDDWGGEPA